MFSEQIFQRKQSLGAPVKSLIKLSFVFSLWIINEFLKSLKNFHSLHISYNDKEGNKRGGTNQYSKSSYWKHSFSKVKEKTKQRGNKKTWNKHRCKKIGQAVIRKPNQRRRRQKSNRFCPVHMYPDIFDYGDFYLHFQTNTQPHVAYSNRSHPSTRKR